MYFQICFFYIGRTFITIYSIVVVPLKVSRDTLSLPSLI